jgi:O-antigen/teichoic acid export membrane protein
MKATSLFGGVQVFQIIIQVLKSKIIAVLLGTNGIGVLGLLNSTVELISRFTNFGLSLSGVKEIAAANSTENQTQVAVTTTIIRRLVWITGFLGSICMLVLSPWLSHITFGNQDYTYAFIWISITLLLNQLSAGQLVILQGMRKLKYLAKANMLGTLLGLIFTVPLYYFWGLDGIVPGIIVTSIIAVVLSWVYSKKVHIENVVISKEQAFTEGKRILVMGFMISLSGLISQGASYGIRIFISNTGGIDQVGLYTAGFLIINSYVGLVFSAMGTDYYPRLSAVADSNTKSKETINQQAEIAILILAPILNIFIVLVNWVILLMYSTKFIPINEMIIWAALGMFFKAASWSIAFIFLAKGSARIFFWNEVICNAYLIGLSLLGYHFMGLKGIGISFLITYFIYSFQVFNLSRVKFKFSLTSEFIRIFSVQFCLAIVSFLAVQFIRNPYQYIVGVPMILLSISYSFLELDKHLNLKNLFQSYLKK